MNIINYRVLWKSHPYGWFLRYLSIDGGYTAELFLEAPGFRCLTSGALPSDDANAAATLCDQILTDVAKESGREHEKTYTGFVVPILDSEETPIPGYYYYPRQDARNCTRLYFELILLIDSHLRAEILRNLKRDDIWRATG